MIIWLSSSPLYQLSVLNDWIFSALTTGILYLGPESAMPIATFLAVIIGFLLLFWRLILKAIKKPFSYIKNKITGENTNEIKSIDSIEATQEDNKDL